MTVTYRRYLSVVDRRLGRHVKRDDRDALYAVAPKPRRLLSSVDWTRQVGIFDQGQVGSCTFNAAAGCLGTDGKGRTGTNLAHVTKADTYKIFKVQDYVVQENPFVLSGYTLTTKIDGYPGDMPTEDTGSDGPSAASALVLLGLATKYNHAFSEAALQTALQDGPVMWGTVWLNSMYDLNAHDELVVDVNSGEAGGHEMEISGWDKTTNMYKVPNSWGTGFGDHGYLYVSSPNMVTLLGMDGDVTTPVFVTAAPTPPAPVVTLTGQQFYDKIKTVAVAGGLK